jgi:hypothetical protein
VIPPEIAPAGRSRADDIDTFVDARQEHVAEVDGPHPIIDLLEADECCLSEFARKSRRFLNRIVPAFVTRLGM